MADIGLRLTGVDLALRTLEQYGPREMERAVQRATMAGARVAARLEKAIAPVKTGNLRRSIRARRGRRDYAAAIAGPTARHRHLVIRGHRIVTPGGTFTGRRTRPNPFVDRAVDAGRPLIVEAVRRELYKR